MNQATTKLKVGRAASISVLEHAFEGEGKGRSMLLLMAYIL